MATARDVITRSLLLIGAIEAGDAPSAEDASTGLDGLNEMLHAWEREGIDYQHTDLALSDSLTLDATQIEAVRYNLAVRLAPEYGAPASQEITAIAQRGYAALRRPVAADPADVEALTVNSAQNMIKRAMRLVRVIEAGEDLATRDLNNGLATLNDMLYGWSKEGLEIGHSTLDDLSDPILLHPSYFEGVRYNLAVRLAAEYEDAVLTPYIADRAQRTFSAFQSHAFEYEDELSVDKGLQSRYFTRRYGGYNIEDDS